MDDTHSVASLIDSTTSKIQELQQAFAELESHRAVSLNLKWKELEEHFHGLERSLKERFNELKDQERQYEAKVTKACEMLKKKEAMVVAKERASLMRLQAKRDAAFNDIGKAFKKRKLSPFVPISKDENSDVSTITEELHDIPADEDFLDTATSRNNTKTDSCYVADMSSSRNGYINEKGSCPLIEFCISMDIKGLQKYISDNRKNLASIREEIPTALRKAPNPFYLVLGSLKDFYGTELFVGDGKKDGTLLGVQRTCVMLMESLSLMMQENETSGSACTEIPVDIKLEAKAMADEWKPKLEDLELDVSSGNSLETHAFLQLLATFKVVSDFNQDEICELIPSVSRRRQIADLCRSLGLTKRMPGVIEVLANSGKQIDAVNLAYAFGLTEQFPPVPLLKSYLKDAKKSAMPKSGINSPGTQNNDECERELHALKAIVRCIEEHKLEEQYPVDPLQKRLIQLEKAKADKKRVAEVAKPQPKRPRANIVNGHASGGCGYVPRAANLPEKSYYRVPDRYPYAYDRQFSHATEAHGSPVPNSPYNISPSPAGGYYTNGYQYHQYYQAHLSH